MNITQIKCQLGVSELKWRPCTEQTLVNNVPTEVESDTWVRAWADYQLIGTDGKLVVGQVDVHMHAETYAKGPNNPKLSIQHQEERVSKAGKVYRFVRLAEFKDENVIATW